MKTGDKKKEFNIIFYPSTLEQLNLILNETVKNDEYAAKIGDIEIGLVHTDEDSQTFYIHRKN